MFLRGRSLAGSTGGSAALPTAESRLGRRTALTFPLFDPSEIALFARLVLPRLREAGIWVHPAERDWCW